MQVFAGTSLLNIYAIGSHSTVAPSLWASEHYECLKKFVPLTVDKMIFFKVGVTIILAIYSQINNFSVSK